MLWSFSIIFFWLFSIFSSTSETISKPSFGIGIGRYFSSKTFSDIFPPHFIKTEGAHDNSFKDCLLSTDGFGTEDKRFLVQKILLPILEIVL